MLTEAELSEAYKKFDNDRVIKLAKLESKSLREIAVPILENEIKKRNLDENLLEWIKLERNLYKDSELETLKDKILKSTCTECNKKGNNIKGFFIHNCSIWNKPNRMNLILCEDCGKKERRKNYIISATLGWISRTGIVQVPIYFIGEAINSFSRKKISNKIIEDFIHEHTGHIRKAGMENIEKIIEKYNFYEKKLKVHEDDYFMGLFYEAH